MTKLSRFRKTNATELWRAEVDNLEAITMYYVHTGRNAWHSTWIKQYFEGCMHTTLRSAKAYAESKRVQGTVLNISELPALHISSSVGSLFVTQINTNVPLMDYSRSALRDSHRLHDLMENHRNDYLVSGAPIKGVVLSFDFDSGFWRSLPPTENSVIITTTSEKNFETSVFHTVNKHRSSLSYGGKYSLGWVEKDSEISADGISRLLGD